MKPFEVIFENEELEGHYRGRYIRILFAHLLVMGVMKRGNAVKYWSNCDITK